MDNLESGPKPAQENHGESTPEYGKGDNSEAHVEEVGHDEPHAIETHAEVEPGGTLEEYRALVEEIKGKEGSFFSSEGARNEQMKKLEQLAQTLARENYHFKHELEKAFERGLKGDLGRTEYRWTDQVFIKAFEELDSNHPESH